MNKLKLSNASTCFVGRLTLQHKIPSYDARLRRRGVIKLRRGALLSPRITATKIEMSRPSEKIKLHPSNHTPSDLKRTVFDVICIGSGWAGRLLAARIVKSGYTPVIVEQELVGGDCPFWACVPSKVLLRSTEALEGAKGVGGARERVDVSTDEGVDVGKVFSRRDTFTAGWDDGNVLVPMVKSAGVAIVRGKGRLRGVKRVQVEPYQGRAIVELIANLAVVLCTGSEPIVPDIPGLLEADPWTPRDATSASYVPKHLLILGGGAVGCEMATAYANFGAEVTLVSSSPELLPSVDPKAGKIVRDAMAAVKIDVRVGTKVTRFSVGLRRQLLWNCPQESRSLHLSYCLLLAARQRLDDLGLETVGCHPEARFLAVDESLCVNIPGKPWLYAAGDVNGRALLTHTSKYHARIAANAILMRATGYLDISQQWSNTSATADKLAAPQVVFTNPIVASKWPDSRGSQGPRERRTCHHSA